MQTWLLSQVCFPHVTASLPNPIFGDLELFAATSFMKMGNLCALFQLKNIGANFYGFFQIYIKKQFCYAFLFSYARVSGIL